LIFICKLVISARPVARAVTVRPLSVSVKNLLGSDAVFAKMEDRIDAAAVAKVKVSLFFAVL
jgi:hypothetical protein